MQRKNAKCTIIGSFNSYIILASLSFCHFKLCVCFFLTFFLVWISLFLNPNICFLAWQTRLHPRWWEEQIIPLQTPDSQSVTICESLQDARCLSWFLVSGLSRTSFPPQHIMCQVLPRINSLIGVNMAEEEDDNAHAEKTVTMPGSPEAGHGASPAQSYCYPSGRGQDWAAQDIITAQLRSQEPRVSWRN